MANTILTPTMIVKEAARQFMNNCIIMRTMTRKFERDFRWGGMKAGQTINLRMPPRYLGGTGATMTPEDHVEWTRPFTVYPQAWVGVQFTSFELTFSLQEFGDTVLKGPMTTLGNKVDLDAALMIKNYTPNLVGTPGTTPSSLLTINTANAYLAQDACPQDDQRYLMLEPIAMATYGDAVKGLFNPNMVVSDAVRTGQVRDMMGVTWGMDQNVPIHTVGPLGGTPLTNGANQGIITGPADYTDLVTDGWTAAAATRLNRGDKITIGTLANGVVAVNPVNKQTLGRLRQFTVSSTTEGNVSSDGAGNATIRIRPAIIAGGPFQNVVARPADNVAINVVGTANTSYPWNLLYHKEAFACAMFEIQQPGEGEGVRGATLVDPQTGISISYKRQYNILTDQHIGRFDIAYALGPYNPEWACIITG